MIQPLRVTPEMRVFTNTLGQPIEPNSLLQHWYACHRALSIRVRGLYCTKDTFVTTSFNAGVKIAWLEQQTGVAYATLRRHYGEVDAERGRERAPALRGTRSGAVQRANCVRGPGPCGHNLRKWS